MDNCQPKQEKDGKLAMSRRYFLTDDHIVQAFWNVQSNVHLAMRMLIRNFVEQYGMVDVCGVLSLVPPEKAKGDDEV